MSTYNSTFVIWKLIEWGDRFCTLAWDAGQQDFSVLLHNDNRTKTKWCVQSPMLYKTVQLFLPLSVQEVNWREIYIQFYIHIPGRYWVDAACHVEVVVCAADMVGSSVVTLLERNAYPPTLHTHTLHFLSVISTYQYLTCTKNIQTHTAPSLSHTHTHTYTNEVTNICLPFFFFCSCPPHRGNHTASLLGFAAEGRDAHFLIYNLLEVETGKRIALLSWLISYGLRAAVCRCCLTRHMCTDAGTCMEKDCTAHLKRFAPHTDLFKRSDVFHFSGLEFRMYHTRRRAAHTDYCLSASHSVSSLLPLILFIIFLLYIQWAGSLQIASFLMQFSISLLSHLLSYCLLWFPTFSDQHVP